MSAIDASRGRSRSETAAAAGRFEDPRELGRLLPASLRIGMAQSAFQTEGSLEAGGRGPSVWDEFAGRRRTIAGEATPETATDFVVRWADDVRLLQDLGVRDLRLSFSWSRVQPAGRGPIERAGAGFYDRVLDGLAEAGIRALVTLHHRDTPAALSGGWQRRDTALRFGDYAFEMGSRFGDRVHAWATLDEPTTVMLEGYALTRHAPGAGRLFSALPALHHQLLGHGIAVEALRAADVPGAIGIVEGHAVVDPASEGEADRAWADLVDVLRNRLVPEAVLRGRYPVGPEELPPFLAPLAEIDPADLARIRAPLDFYGVDPLPPLRIAAGRDPGAPMGVGAPPTWPFHERPWPEFAQDGAGRPVVPAALGAILGSLRERFGDDLPPVVVGALGLGQPDEQDQDGVVRDLDRIRWLGAHLAALVEATAPGGSADGVGVDAVYLWTLVDAFEWADGYSRPSGLVGLEARTNDRVPKASYDWLRRVLDARS